MASRVLYPPVIDSSLPAFIASSGTLKVPISFSKFNNTSEFSSAQVSIVKKDTGASVVNTANNTSSGRYRATGIILNIPVQSATVDGITTYYIEILAEDLNSSVYGQTGWIPGWFYKIQVRLSAVDYSGSGGQQAWLNNNASNFSEWSTVCIIKAIGDITINIDSFDYTYTTEGQSSSSTEIFGNALTFSGDYSCIDSTETLAYYRLKIYNYPRKENDSPLDDSGYIYNTAVDVNEFNYTFRIASKEDASRYIIEVEYNTINDFNDIFDIDFTLSQIKLDPIGARIVTVDNDIYGIFDDISSVNMEEEEGRIALKLYAADTDPFSGNLCVRRASSRDNFTIWEDIKILTFKQQTISSSPIWYDYTIESGVWYKYGVQSINEDDERSEMNQTNAIMRNFNYSFLLGENEQQLKLMFDNNMGSFKRQITESHTDTIGGKYSVFSRTAATDYKTFPLNGLISFWMDEQNTFTSKLVVYGNEDIVNLYNNYNNENNITQYDYIYEREFRDLVSNFLYDGKPKIFKSPTEGNLIIRITDVNLVPNQSLSRMIYSFSSTAYELDDNTVDNYKKYNFITLDDIETDFSITTEKLGQYNGVVNTTDNIFNLIYNKYHRENNLGYNYDVKDIKGIRITIDEEPMRVINSGGNYVLGYNIRLNGNLITLRDTNIYELDPDIEFTPANSLYILGDAEGSVTQVNVIIDFIYSETTSIYEGKKISSKVVKSGIGQIIGSYSAGTSLYKIIYNKYSYDWAKSYCTLNKISSIDIEAVPGAVFLIQDESESTGEQHIINSTELLSFKSISNIIKIDYLGVIDEETGEINNVKTDIILNYYYTVVEGGYQ